MNDVSRVIPKDDSPQNSRTWVNTFDGHYFSWSLSFYLANSKSEGSPVLPHEPSKVKPEESRDITRPSRPAVSAFELL